MRVPHRPRRSILILLFLFLCLTSAPVSAHVLLPKALVEYIEQHPNATAEEIQQYVDQNPNLKAVDNARQDKLVQIARNQGSANFFQTVYEFIILGFEHILSGPDHILFVFSLLLTFVSLRKTAWLLSCFTLSHSITLILAGTNILRVSSLIVEPIIALSIAYVAITSIFVAPRYPFFADNRAKALTVLGFGFFHGMGFAGALQDIALPTSRFLFLSSLLSFNVGVDIGQLFIVIVSLPLLLLVRRSSWHRRITQVAAVLISLLAMAWFVQRILYPA